MISIDTVYQKVLVIANKEQRGYITPQEFNLYANQAQMDIFEQYFYDLNQFARMPSVGIEYSDVDEKIDEKLSVFKSTASGSGANMALPIDLYKIGTIWDNDNVTEIHKVDHRELTYMLNSPLATPTAQRPVYVIDATQISVFPEVDNILFRYIRIPLISRWTYTVVRMPDGDGHAQYNATAQDLQDFELHPSDEVNLVIKILEFAGITIKDPSLYQIAAQEEMRNIQQEKQ